MSYHPGIVMPIFFQHSQSALFNRPRRENERDFFEFASATPVLCKTDPRIGYQIWFLRVKSSSRVGYSYQPAPLRTSNVLLDRGDHEGSPKDEAENRE
ncbi:hypothetical protein TMatcc_001553 [Talaromyces marneffei ATCC 18224]